MMEFTALVINGLISPVTWIPAFAMVLILRKHPWYIRTTGAGLVTGVIGIGLALLLTPGDPNNLLTLAGWVIASAIWASIGSFVIFGARITPND